MKKPAVIIYPIVALILILISSTIYFVGRANGAIAGDSIFKNKAAPQLADPPWYDEAWHYRRPITIHNNGTMLLNYYQVLVTLNEGNFNFSHANPGGLDVRFTDGSGKNLLTYWIESWDAEKKTAYLWVLVSSILPEPYDTQIYLYYGNSNPTPINLGNPFDLFDDDWCQFAGCQADQNVPPYQPNLAQQELGSESSIESSLWTTFGTGSLAISSGNLILGSPKGVKAAGPYIYQAVGYRAKFSTGNGQEWIGFINDKIGAPHAVIGDLNTDPDEMYLRNWKSAETRVLLPRVNGADWHDTYHVFEVRWCILAKNCSVSKTIAAIDHADPIMLTTQVPTGGLPVTMDNNSTVGPTLEVDWIYVRQYREPEPTASMGREQGLVDLDVTMTDSPDPVRTGTELTYQISVYNNSNVPAAGVVVTDTLPASTMLSYTTPPGVCKGSVDLVCALGTISENSITNLSITVIPSIDEVISNTVTAGSPGYELDWSNNGDEVGTLVDSVPPSVNWEKPVTNEQYFTTNDRLITLEASAADATDRIFWVQFVLYDHLEPDPVLRWKDIGSHDYYYPYQAQLDNSGLVPNVWYQLFVKASDRAGNVSNPLEPVRRIIVMHTAEYEIDLPLVIK